MFGVSVDSWASLKKYRKELNLPFDLLSDWDRQVSKKYGVFNEKELVANRKSFLVDKNGFVRFTQQSGLNEPRKHEEMLSAVRKLRENAAGEQTAQAEASAPVNATFYEFYSENIEAAMNDIWTRLHKNLSTVLRQLSPKDELDAKGNQKYNKLYDSVFDTSLELIRMMRRFNITGDTQMTAVADQLEGALYGVNTDALKNSETLRLDKQQQVKDIISKLPSLDL